MLASGAPVVVYSFGIPMPTQRQVDVVPELRLSKSLSPQGLPDRSMFHDPCRLPRHLGTRPGFIDGWFYRFCPAHSELAQANKCGRGEGTAYR